MNLTDVFSVIFVLFLASFFGIRAIKYLRTGKDWGLILIIVSFGLFLNEYYSLALYLEDKVELGEGYFFEILPFLIPLLLAFLSLLSISKIIKK